MNEQAQIIDKLVSRIVELVNPLQIILFGSAARGETTPDSDIDLLVVMPNGTHQRETAQRLYRDIRGIKAPFDILVATPSVLEKHRDNIGLIYYVILEEGKSVYVAERNHTGIS